MSVGASPLEGLGVPEGFAEAVGADGEALADAERYRAMLAEANEGMNLVGASTLDDFWMRHFVDSAQLRLFAPEAKVWADLGTGAGLPGVILAILLKRTPGARVHLVESVAKKARFLREVADALTLPAQVHLARAEDLKLDVEVVTARACAPLSRLLGYAAPHLRGGAEGLFLKGENVEAEIAEARQSWAFEAQASPSVSNARGRVLRVSNLREARR